MITVKSGDFSKSFRYLKKLQSAMKNRSFDKYGQEGVRALQAATPVDTGKTAASWTYEVTQKNGVITISWKNSNIQNGVPIAIILQYGHATKNGGWVRGRDYINPALRPVFEKMAQEAWREVTGP